MAGGIVSDACKYLRQKWNHPLSRSTIYNALAVDPELKALVKQCEGVTFDVCYRGIVARAEAGNPRDQRILFTRLSQNHGISNAQRIEITGADGNPVQHEVVADGELSQEEMENLSVAELDVLIAAERIKHANRSGISEKAGTD